MSFCNEECSTQIAPWGAQGACDPGYRKGSICNVVLLACDIKWSIGPNEDPDYYDLTNPVDVQELIDQCKIRITPQLDGEKAKGEPTYVFRGFCGGKALENVKHMVSFKCYESDIQNFKEFDNWNLVNQKKDRYRVGWFDKDGNLYGFYQMFESFADNVIGAGSENSPGSSYIDGSFTIQDINILKPYAAASLNGLQELLSLNQNEGSGCGGDIVAPVNPFMPFAPEVESIGGSNGNTISGTQAVLEGINVVLSIKVGKLTGCATNVVCTGGALPTGFVYVGSNVATFTNLANTDQVQTLTVTIPMGVDPNQLYFIPLSFVGCGFAKSIGASIVVFP